MSGYNSLGKLVENEVIKIIKIEIDPEFIDQCAYSENSEKFKK